MRARLRSARSASQPAAQQAAPHPACPAAYRINRLSRTRLSRAAGRPRHPPSAHGPACQAHLPHPRPQGPMAEECRAPSRRPGRPTRRRALPGHGPPRALPLTASRLGPAGGREQEVRAVPDAPQAPTTRRRAQALSVSQQRPMVMTMTTIRPRLAPCHYLRLPWHARHQHGQRLLRLGRATQKRHASTRRGGRLRCAWCSHS